MVFVFIAQQGVPYAAHATAYAAQQDEDQDTAAFDNELEFKGGMKKVASDGSVSVEESAPLPVVPAVSPPAPEPDPKARELISLSLRNIDILEALKFFALKSGFNIVPTKSVAGRITLNVEKAPVQDVFDIMLRSSNLAYDKQGGIYNVMTEEEYKARYGKAFADARQVRIFRLKYAIPSQAFSLLEAVKSSIGRLLVDTESGSILFIDTPEKIAEAEKTLAAVEQQNVVKVFTLKYAKAKEVEEQLKNQLDLRKVGSVKSDERTNQVVVQTLPRRMKNIEQLIADLDKKTKGVLVDIKIIKIKLNDQHDRGFQWEGLFNVAKSYGMAYVGSYPFSAMTAGITSPTFTTRTDTYAAGGNQIGNYPFSGTTSSLNSSTKISPGENMHIGIVDRKRDFDAVVNYLQTLGKSKILASPSLSVINNQEANIHIGERRAYVTTTTTTGSTTTTVSEEVTYVDIGIRLSMTPTINDDGYVVLKVKPEISNVVGTVTTSSDNEIPILDTNTA
jgi:type II secretory pathway component GspD/PulD (secretin)